MEASLPWVEKYRPATLDDLVAHADIVNVLQKLIAANKLPHLLFYGPPGTGKTSTILAAARQMYGSKAFGAMVLELNASDDRGIDVVRNQARYTERGRAHALARRDPGILSRGRAISVCPRVCTRATRIGSSRRRVLGAVLGRALRRSKSLPARSVSSHRASSSSCSTRPTR